MTNEPQPGDRGIVVIGLKPMGKVSIGGAEYIALLKSGQARNGDEVVVLKVADFGLIVKLADDSA